MKSDSQEIFRFLIPPLSIKWQEMKSRIRTCRWKSHVGFVFVECILAINQANPCSNSRYEPSTINTIGKQRRKERTNGLPASIENAIELKRVKRRVGVPGAGQGQGFLNWDFGVKFIDQLLRSGSNLMPRRRRKRWQWRTNCAMQRAWDWKERPCMTLRAWFMALVTEDGNSSYGVEHGNLHRHSYQQASCSSLSSPRDFLERKDDGVGNISVLDTFNY